MGTALRHRGVRGLVQLREVLELADYGAESPQETRTRLVLTFAGLILSLASHLPIFQ